MKTKSILIGAALMAMSASVAHSQEAIRAVGSSTVYPFTTVVAERFGRTTNYPTPIVESTGTGGGFKLFCEGAGTDTPSISNASRAIKSSERASCASNGVNNVIEVKIGYDGIVMANAVGAQQYQLTTKEIFMALGAIVPDADGRLVPNPYTLWSEINADLPATQILVMGPPPTSGTRDAFLELAMESGCDQVEAIKALKSTDSTRHKNLCHGIREDGPYVDAGENDNLIVQRLIANPNAIGIFGFSFLEENSDTVQGSIINGVEPSFDNIADGTYPVSRPLYFYVKGEHLSKVAGLKEFMDEFTSDRASGEEGYLSERGLIPMTDEERSEIVRAIAAQTR